MKYFVIITAGGSGLRMGSNLAKQFLELKGKPILLHTIELFRSLPFDVEIILVLPVAYKEYWKKYCLDNNLWFKYTIVSGGITRFHSVKNALAYVPNNAIVAVHDGVRPFVDKKLLESLFKTEFSGFAGMIPVMPAIESMRERVLDQKGVDIGTKTVNRDMYMFVQTPQVFNSSILKECYQQAFDPSFTDDASVVQKKGYDIRTCEGSRFNIKITKPEDLQLAELVYSFLERQNL